MLRFVLLNNKDEYVIFKLIIKYTHFFAFFMSRFAVLAFVAAVMPLLAAAVAAAVMVTLAATFMVVAAGLRYGLLRFAVFIAAAGFLVFAVPIAVAVLRF